MSASPERWQEISPYLDHALSLSDEERATWLASLREQDPKLAADLERMLEHHRALSSERFLEEQSFAFPGNLIAAGEAINSYTLRVPLGEGGMSTVWLAERSDGRFEGKVAIKFLSAAMAGQIGQERLKREGSFLGRLTHPNIARLMDAGISNNGQRYLVLEYVEGEPIDRYCDLQKLDLKSRVRLFLDVLAAVAHAHAHLIVHRDIKPSNVMVTRDGEVKLLDFGIAKLLQGEATSGAASLLTREGGGALTPQYAAPEQLTGGDITTATDVYALGVLLYVLLTGSHPAGPNQTSTAALVRAITSTPAVRMSEMVEAEQRSESRADIAVTRSTTPDKLRRGLRGDLDTIVAKALKKVPQERYASATAFAGDLRRFLKDEPIHARPDTFFYVTSKFLRRFWLPVAASVLVFASLSAGIYIANHERRIAEQRFAQLRQLSIKIFDLDKNIRNLPGSIEARQRLVSAALGYLNGLAVGARGSAALEQELAEGYWRVARIQGVPTELNLGNTAEAEANLLKGDEILEPLVERDPNNRTALIQSAAIAHDQMILAETEHHNSEALAYMKKAAARLDAATRISGPSAADMIDARSAYGNMALASLNMHLYDEAARYAHRSVELSQGPSGEYRVAQGLSLEAAALLYQGNFDAALATIKNAITIAEKASYPNEVKRTLDGYGIYVRAGLLLGQDGAVNLNQPVDAIDALQKAFDMTRSAAEKVPSDATNRTRMASSGSELANILRYQHPVEALRVYDLALGALREVPASIPVKRKQAMILADSSYALRLLGRGQEARQRIATALKTLQETKDYPSEKLTLGGESYVVERAQADAEAADGSPQKAVALYEHLMQAVIAGDSAASVDFRNAPAMSSLYEAMSKAYHRAGNTVLERDAAERRIRLWREWDQKLPENAYIRSQLAAASRP